MGSSIDRLGLPETQGLYHPAYEHDGCGIGFVAHVRGERSHAIVRDALQLLANLAHRSAVGADESTGDGAGILLQIPHAFLRRSCHACNVPLPEAGGYGVGMCFLPADSGHRAGAEQLIESVVRKQGWRVLGWRDVPVNREHAGEAARRTCPSVRQLFVAPGGVEPAADDATALERALYVMRRRIERVARAEVEAGRASWYVASLSSRTIVYKGLLRPSDLSGFYPDLDDPEVASALALVHSRFSTNTFPSWALAHPYRLICHNGEINTLRGNLNWMRMREEQLASPRFENDIGDLLPVVAPGQSDSASLDNVLELLVHGGRSLAHALMMLIPEAWESEAYAGMPAERRAFYDYHASLMEPWDGPAAVAFTDGRQIGAVLDRNGLRPARYVVTDDDRIILASEAGVLPVAPDRVRAKGRLQPGKMLLVNTTQGRIIDDDELKTELASLRPYHRWTRSQRVSLPPSGSPLLPTRSSATLSLVERQRLFGYTREEMRMVLAPMAFHGEEAVGSMGNDTPLAVLSERPQLLFSYFRQQFAQVTNPAIDPAREQLVMSLTMYLGPQRNLFDETPAHAKQLCLEHPVLTPAHVNALRALDDPELRSTTLEMRFVAADGPTALARALDQLCDDAANAVRAGSALLVLSDHDVDAAWAPIPSLLAVAAVHHHLVRERLRSRASLVVESGEPREVSHIALLIAYGASAVCPYLALESVTSLANTRPRGKDADVPNAEATYIKATEKGLLKVLSKMGISTLQSYCGAQLWEAVGLGRELVDRYFPGTSSPIGGIDLEIVGEETLARHDAAFHAPAAHDEMIEAGGDYHYRAEGEHHNWNPPAIAALQRAAREDNYRSYQEFSRIANDETRRSALRHLLDFVGVTPVPLHEVEPPSAIVRRFVTGAMSFGSISREAHETVAIAMNQIGGRSNTGEGGEDPARFRTARNSAIKQVASARFGVTTEYLVNTVELQIKIAQGAKPGEGGQLPGHKVDAVIARTRHATPGITLISPPPHHDIYSIEDLKQLIEDLKRVNPRATVSVKLVAEAGVGTVAAGVAKAGADLIVISGDSGGTGASPLSSIKRAGIPWELGLAAAQQTLVMNGLRGAVRLQTDGQLKTGRDVAIAALLGAEEFGFATAPLIAAGCVMMRKCHLNTCPVGIATQDPELRAKFTGRPEHLINYFFFVAEELRDIMARIGCRTVDEMVGRVDLLRSSVPAEHRKARTLDLSALLHVPSAADGGQTIRRRARQRPQLSESFDETLLEIARPAIEHGERVSAALPIRNVNRTAGANLAGEIARRHGNEGLPPETITLRFTGSAGQSFGAFATRGLALELEGEANDYAGKGLSGGRLVIRPPKTSRLLSADAIIVGNTVLYGATAGEAFIAGAAGERFAVRNSGASAVVEGVGDHGCEYMTGGVVVVLGGTGRNFAAGMSGGVAFVLDERRELEARCNTGMVALAPVVETADHTVLHGLVERHARLTGSLRARHALAHWDRTLRHFVRVLPREYQRALAEQATAAMADGLRHG